MARIDLSSVTTATPDPEPGILADIGQTADRIDFSKVGKQTAQSEPGIRADRMPAVAAAGVVLTKVVLAMVMSSVVMLMLYLFVVDIDNGRYLDQAYGSVIRQATIGSDMPDVVQTDRIRKVLAAARADPDLKLTADQERDGLTLIKAFGRTSTVSDLQRETLRRCIPLPSSRDERNTVLDNCIETVGVLQNEALAGSANLEKIRLLADFAKEVNEHRQTFRAFWMQASQLILLNLLLPLLTALLGYIFGTTQAARQGGAGTS